jgi:hypothetical protein
MNHVRKYGIGKAAKLELMLKAANIKYDNTERVYEELFEKAFLFNRQKIGKTLSDTLYHHFILKGRWSYCWTTDCDESCPKDRCWLATRDDINCTSCVRSHKGNMIKCPKTANRKHPYAEYDKCDRSLPEKLDDRLKMLFNIHSVKIIDDMEIGDTADDKGEFTLTDNSGQV